MELQVMQVLALCMQAKEKGHDCFLSYTPHVNKIEVRIFNNGWESQTDADVYMDCDLTTNQPSEKVLHVEYVTIEEMIERLQNLIKEEENE